MTNSTSARSPEIRRTPENEALLLRLAEIPSNLAFLEHAMYRTDPSLTVAEVAVKGSSTDQVQTPEAKVEAVVTDLGAVRQLRDARDSVEGAFNVAA